MKEVQICQVIYKDIEVSPSTAPMIRGYFANKYKEIEYIPEEYPPTSEIS